MINEWVSEWVSEDWIINSPKIYTMAWPTKILFGIDIFVTHFQTILFKHVKN